MTSIHTSQDLVHCSSTEPNRRFQHSRVQERMSNTSIKRLVNAHAFEVCDEFSRDTPYVALAVKCPYLVLSSHLMLDLTICSRGHGFVTREPLGMLLHPPSSLHSLIISNNLCALGDTLSPFKCRSQRFCLDC